VTVSSNILKSLEARGWIDVIGHREVPGRPAIFATTKTFLDDLNLRSLEELPALDDLGTLVEAAPPGEVEEPTAESEKTARSADTGVDAAEGSSDDSQLGAEEPQADEALASTAEEGEAVAHEDELSGSVEISADAGDEDNGDLPPGSAADGVHGHVSTRLH
jgi:segregation and condensation protein B